MRKPQRDALLEAFDPEFYATQVPGLKGTPAQLLRHYIAKGAAQGLDPAYGFSARAYRSDYPDVAAAGINPLLHFVFSGRKEGRRGRMLGDRRLSDADLATLPIERQKAVVRPWFNVDFYRRTNPKVDGDSEALLEHFLTLGGFEGADPNRNFSCADYLDRRPDLRAAKVNPFLHYRLIGYWGGEAATRAQGDPQAEELPYRADARSAQPWVHALSARPGPDDRPVAPVQVNPAALDIHWVIPDFSRGGGGHMTIFRMVRAMELAGHRCRIWIDRPQINTEGEQAWDSIVKHFQCLSAPVEFIANGFFAASGDAVIATGWSTAYAVSRATGFAEKFYFVQDLEPAFYPTGPEHIMAGQAYDFGLNCICASPWLRQKMEAHGAWAREFHLAYDHDLYRTPDRDARRVALTARSGPARIAVYARDGTPRRAVQLALAALDILGDKGCGIEVHFFGQDRLPFREVPYKAVNHGVLDERGLAALYDHCDLGLCFSATNYSLVPQEMMAAGLPVVELDGESTRAIFPEGVVTFAGPDPEDIAAKVAALATDRRALAGQMLRALDWVEQFSWEGAAEKVIAAVQERLAAKALASPAVQVMSDPALDVVIPTWNGLAEVQRLVESLRGQADLPGSGLKIWAVDSTSTDGTTEWLRAQADVALTVIPQTEFQHGRTRNLGASLGRAPLVAMVTQDAMPARRHWARDYLMMFAHHPKAAGAFGRHIAWPHHPKPVRDEIDGVFRGLMHHPLALSRSTDPARWAARDQGWRQLLHFFSDNNAVLSRTVWAEIPYPEIDYGEDQVWANRIIEAGFTRLYAPTAAVFHSHDYTPDETRKRSAIEAAFFARQFGYVLGAGNADDIAIRIQREQEAWSAGPSAKSSTAAEIARHLANIAEKHRGWREGRIAAEKDRG